MIGNLPNSKKNKGFTLVEIIISLVILAIITAIAVPITLSIIDSSKESDAKLMAKNIMTAIKTEFNTLAANREQWTSDGGKMGIILNENRKNKGQGSDNEYKNKDEFKNRFIYIYNTVATDNIFNKIENPDDIYMLYVGAGKVFEYYDTEDRYKMYTPYVIIFQLKDEKEPIWIYDGKNIDKKWPFEVPKISDSQDVEWFQVKGDNTHLQMYAFKLPKGLTNANVFTYWKDTVVKKILAQNK